MQKVKFNITGMSCASCSAHVEKAVNKLEGVAKAEVNLLANSMEAEFDENKISSADIIKAVEDAGYGASEKNSKSDNSKKENKNDDVKKSLDEMKRRFLVSLIFMIPLMYIAMGHMYDWPMPDFFKGHETAGIFAFTQFLLTLPIVIINKKYYVNGYKMLFKGSPNMDSLIAVGSSAALFYGVFAIYRILWGLAVGDMELVAKYHMDLYFESAAMILTLITLGKYLEAISKGKTTQAISKLVDLAPKTAIVIRDGKEITIPASQIAKGDIVVVKPGASIPADGIVTEGFSAVDESAITGESIPVSKAVGDSVMCATVNKSGYFKFEATKTGEDTSLAQIIKLVEEAGSSKAPVSRMADKISGVFVPVVMLIALASAVIWLLCGQPFEFALTCGIAVLVISCPCALGLATPVAIMVGTGKGAEKGILIKNAATLENTCKANVCVLDKTGTITKGTPEVTDVYGNDESKVISVAYALEKNSEHPLGEAIIKFAESENILCGKVDDFYSVAGKGVRGSINGNTYTVGSGAYMIELGFMNDEFEKTAEQFAEEGKTPLFVADENSIFGIIAVMDTVKETSKKAIEEFKKLGIEVIMLTGDNEKTANAIKNKVGIDKVYAGVLPQDKERIIREIQSTGKKVIMIGDGINDSPALTRADVGMAIGAGTDIAIEAADIVLIKSDLTDGVSAVKLSAAVMRNIKQNLFWALFYNAICIPVAAGVFYNLTGWLLSPMIGAAAMSLSSVCVVTNALRLRFFKTGFEDDISEKTAQIADNKEHNIVETKTQKGDNIMVKTISIEGMSCGHCTMAVERALNKIEGVLSAKASLEEKNAVVETDGSVSDEALESAVTEEGFTVKGVK